MSGPGLWDDREAAAFTDPLAQRVYTSRLLGRDPALVLHGGGNTSVKIRQPDIFGDEQDILYVKGLMGRFGPDQLHTLVNAFAR